MPRRITACSARVLSLLMVPALAFGQGVTIDHTGVGCVVAGKFPRFDARLDPAGSVARARLHFRPEGGPHWYFVDMKSEAAGLFRGILPKPQKTLPGFSYYIDVTDKAFNASRTAEFTLDVASGPAACGREKVLASTVERARVLVHGPQGVAGAPALPPGFAGEGVATVSGAGVETAATSGAGGAGGIGTTALIVGGVAAAAGAAVLVAASQGEDREPEGQGPPGPTPPGAPPAAPTPTPPPATSLSGTWTGNRPGDGWVLTFSGCGGCPNTPTNAGADLVLTLTQSGTSLSGTLVQTTREVQPAGCSADPTCTKAVIGEVITFSMAGTVNGTSVALQMVGAPAAMSGTVSGNRIAGTLNGTSNDGSTFTGTWSVNRQ
jgi:hypothetical protein